ncbi:hypothetical protein D3C72_2147220 [compost metagenome]
MVFETAGTSHTPTTLSEYGDEIITLNITQGDLLYFDDNDNLFAIENWKSGVERYLAFCAANGIEAKDITSFSI